MKNLTDKNDNNAFTFPLETLLSDRNPLENNSSRKSFKQLSTLRKNYKKLKSSISIDIQKDFETSPQPKELNENFTKTQINFQIQTISIIMVTPFNLSIGKLIGENLKIGLFFKKSSINVDGELEQMRLMDVSGYPLTLCGYLKNQSENDFELLSSKSKRILTFNFQFIDDDCCIEDKIYNYINFSFDGLILNYLQQPVLRIFDYLNEKVLGVLTYDYKTEEKLKSDPRRLRQIIKDPRFTDLNFKFTNLEVNILIMPLLQERMKIFIKDVIIGNSSSKDYERIPKIVIDKRFQDYIFIDTITMNLNSLNIYKQEEGFNDLKKISTEFNIEINIKRIINSEDVHCFFSSIVEIDDSIKINISINNFKLQLQKPDYCHIMKLVYNNLIYDDGLDKFIYFGPDSKDISLLPRTCSILLIYKLIL